MTRTAIGLLATLLVPAACGRVDDLTIELTSQAVTTATTTAQEFRVGVINNQDVLGIIVDDSQATSTSTSSTTSSTRASSSTSR